MAKVVLLTPFFYGIGGAETFAQEIHRQANKEHIVWLCTTSWKKIWKGINWLDGIRVSIKLFFSAIKVCGKCNIDTIYALGFNAAFVGVILKLIFPIKLVVTPLALYDFNNKLLKLLAEWTLKHADIVIVESKISKKNLSVICDKSKIKIFTHWIDRDIFYPINNKNKILHVLFVGRDIPEKGIFIIKGVEKLLKGVRFTYAQDIPNEALAKYYQMADVLVVPSLYAESPNRVVAEGAACGCVVVASNKGALAEQTKDFGISIDPTILNYAKIINLLDRDREWLNKMRLDTIQYSKEYLTEKNAEVILKEF